MSYSRTFKKGKNKMRISKKYLLNNDDIVRVGQKLYEVADMVSTLPYTVDADYSEGDIAEIFLHGNNKKAIPTLFLVTSTKIIKLFTLKGM